MFEGRTRNEIIDQNTDDVYYGIYWSKVAIVPQTTLGVFWVNPAIHIMSIQSSLPYSYCRTVPGTSSGNPVDLISRKQIGHAYDSSHVHNSCRTDRTLAAKKHDA